MMIHTRTQVSNEKIIIVLHAHSPFRLILKCFFFQRVEIPTKHWWHMFLPAFGQFHSIFFATNTQNSIPLAMNEIDQAGRRMCDPQCI